MMPEFITGFFGFLKIAMIGGFVLCAVFMVLVALPRSPFRDFVMQGLLWGIVLACGFVWLSPIDFIPLLPFDNLVAGGTGLSAAAVAIVQKVRHARADAEAAIHPVARAEAA